MKLHEMENTVRQGMGLPPQNYDQMVADATEKDINAIPDMSGMFNQIEKIKGNETEGPSQAEAEDGKEALTSAEQERLHKITDEDALNEVQEDTSEDTGEVEDLGEIIEFSPEQKEKKPDRYRNRYYRTAAEKEALQERVVQLEQMLAESSNSGIYHYGKYAYAELDKAKDDVKKAIEEGNVDKLVEANIALNKATRSVDEIERWAVNNTNTGAQYQQQETNAYQQYAPEYAPQYQQQVLRVRPNYTPQNQHYEAMHKEIAADWLENHPYLQPYSKEYNPEMANQVAEFVNNLDSHLVKTNQADRYFSDAYFNTIDNHIKSVNQKAQKVSKNIAAFSNAGAVRTNGPVNMNGNKMQTNNRVTLSEDEKKMCANLKNLINVTENDWIRNKTELYAGGKRV